MTLENGYLLKHRYRILDILGQGGMGAVYRAVDENLDITVAIKENSFFSDDYARQFQREAKVLASLRHPNLPRVFDYFVIEGQAQYLVMDYIEGDDLRQWMSRGEGITEIEALQIGIAICNALIYLHSRVPAITHRDIKPGNIKLTPGGEIVLVDFGLVKILHENEVTTTAAKAMTPGYSPPEQYGDEPTDHRSDIFSLGATLYAALSGYLPEDSLARTTGKAELTPLRSYQPHLCRQTRLAIEKALSLRFEDRWQSARDFKQALISARDMLPAELKAKSRLAPSEPPDSENGEGFLSTTEGAERRIQAVFLWFKNLDPVWSIFSAAIGLLLLVLLISFIRPPGFQQMFSGAFQITPTDLVMIEADLTQNEDPITTGMVDTLGPTPSPVPTEDEIVPIEAVPSPTPVGGSGGVIAFVSERTGLPQIWLVDVNSRETTQLTDIEDGACQPDWSPNASQLVFTSPCTGKRSRYPGSRLYIIDLENGALTPLPASLEGDYDPAWSPDGEWIAFTTLVNNRSQLAKINVNDLRMVRLSDNDFQDSSPAWSPDGTRLAFVRVYGYAQIWLMDPEGENAVQFTLSGMIDNSNPTWFPDGNLILFSQALGLGSPSKQLYGMRLEDIGQSKEYPIKPRKYLDYVPLMDNVDVSPDGFWLAFDYWYFDKLSDIYVMTFPGASLIQLTDHTRMDYDPVWAPLP
ncbi:MAG: serine/threonine-protein kinase [Brevefilum sp.]|nr:serine/threonine-protein kinase [Brevefilum sp.]